MANARVRHIDTQCLGKPRAALTKYSNKYDKQETRIECCWIKGLLESCRIYSSTNGTNSIAYLLIIAIV